MKVKLIRAQSMMRKWPLPLLQSHLWLLSTNNECNRNNKLISLYGSHLCLWKCYFFYLKYCHKYCLPGKFQLCTKTLWGHNFLFETFPVQSLKIILSVILPLEANNNYYYWLPFIECLFCSRDDKTKVV